MFFFGCVDVCPLFLPLVTVKKMVNSPICPTELMLSHQLQGEFLALEETEEKPCFQAGSFMTVQNFKQRHHERTVADRSFYI